MVQGLELYSNLRQEVLTSLPPVLLHLPSQSLVLLGVKLVHGPQCRPAIHHFPPLWSQTIPSRLHLKEFPHSRVLKVLEATGDLWSKDFLFPLAVRLSTR